MTAPIPRRAALALLAGSGLGLVVGCSSGPSAEERACERVQGAVPEVPRGLVVIGTRYRELHPDDDWNAVGEDLPRQDGARALDALTDRVRTDFETGDVVDVDGWVLARSEARAAAVLAGC